MSIREKDLLDRNDVELVKGIQFGLFSHHDIIKGSVCDIRSIDTYDGNIPKNNGLFDHNMGTIDRSIICPVDQKRSELCPGYFGKIDLALPVFNYNFMPYIEKLLKCVCFRCSSLLIDKNDPLVIREVEGKKGYNRFVAICNICLKNKNKKCMYNSSCMVLQPTKYTRLSAANIKEKDNIVKIKAEFNQSAFKDAKIQKEQIFTPEYCYNIFRNIKDEDVDFLGFSSKESRPEWMIIKNLPVPPPNVRPSIRQSDNQRSEDDLSYGLSMIIKANKGLKQLMDNNGKEKNINEHQGFLQYQVATYMNNEIPGVVGSRQRSSYRPLKAIAQRLKGKEGRMRGNIMGKRVDYSARAVISVDPNINIDEFGMAEKIAMVLTFPDIVTPYNITQLRKAVKNGTKTYPGAKSVIKQSSGITFNLKHVDVQKVAAELEYGDIVNRHLIDGDICLFNRQPTLHRMSMMGHKIKVLPGNTFRLNITDCDPYNADFDGDEMNVHCAQSYQTLEELRRLTLVPTQMISPGKSSPVLYLVQDTLLGGYLMTQDHIKLKKNDIHNLLSFKDNYNGYLPTPTGEEDGEPYWTGKQVFSMIIPDVTIMDLKKVKIKRGEIVDGFLEKKSLGDNSGGLVHQIYNSFGVNETTDFLNDSQNLVTRWITNHSFSISFRDCLISNDDHKIVRNIVKDHIKEAQELIQKAQQGLYMPDLDDIYKAQKLEIDIVGIVNKAGEEIKKHIYDNASDMIKDNSFFKEVYSGAQGKDVNFQNIIGCCGQQDFQGGRIPYGFTNRTLPHFHRYDISPDSRGFVRNSFGKGLSPSEVFFAAMSGRLSNISKSITTADSGYTSRKYIKATEDLKIAYDFTVRNATNSIVQFSYGDDNYDPTKIEHMSIKMFEYSDEKMKSIYEFDQNMIENRSYWESFMTKDAVEELLSNSQYVEILNKEYKDMMQGRDLMRNVFFKNAKLISDASCYTPVNLYRMIQSNLVKFNIQPYQLSDISPLYVIEKYKSMMDSVLKYMPEKANSVIIQQILFRSFMASKRIIKEYRMNKLMFDYLIETIRHKIIDSFIQPGEMVGVIAAQTLGESSTQLTMNAFHTAGSASGSSITRGLPRLREIIQITKKLKQQTMHVYLTNEYNNSKENARKALAKITYTKLRDLLSRSEIIYNGENTLNDDDEDREFMKSYKDFVTIFGMEDKNCFSPWTLRLVFDKEAMMNRKISVHEIQEIIKESSYNDEDIECMFSDDNSSDVVMRIRIKNDGKSEYYELMKDFEKSLIDLKLRGIKNIDSVDPDESNIVKIEPNGDVKDTKEWLLVTGGSNMVDILAQEGVDTTRTITNDIVEFYEIFGIEAARSLLYHEFMEVYEGKTVPRHVKIMVDVMTYRGKLMQIDRHGLNRSNDISPFSKACFEEVLNTVVKAGLFAERDNMKGVSANIAMAQFCSAGTTCFDLLMDEDKLAEIEQNNYSLMMDLDMGEATIEDVDNSYNSTYVESEKFEDIDDNAFDFGFGIEKHKEHKLNVNKTVSDIKVVNNSNNKGNNNFGKINEVANLQEGELNLGNIEIEEEATNVQQVDGEENELENMEIDDVEEDVQESKSNSKSKSKSKKEPSVEEITGGIKIKVKKSIVKKIKV